MQNGLMFVYGVGGYDGTNIDTTSTGNSFLESLTSLNVKVKASTGNINLVSVKALDLIDVEASTGDIKLTLQPTNALSPIIVLYFFLPS